MNRAWCGLVAVLVCWGNTRADEAEAVAALKKAGGTILYVDNNPSKPVRSVYLPGKKVKDEDLKNLAGLSHLQVLKLDAASNVTDDGLKELAGLKQLTDLGLGSTKVTDAGLKHLSGLKELRQLNLNFTTVTDAGLKDLEGFKNLETLGLTFTKVTPEGIKKLQEALPKCKIIR